MILFAESLRETVPSVLVCVVPLDVGVVGVVGDVGVVDVVGVVVPVLVCAVVDTGAVVVSILV